MAATSAPAARGSRAEQGDVVKATVAIEATLVQSIRTAERHISTVYGKLGAHGGAAWATVVSYALSRHLLDS